LWAEHLADLQPIVHKMLRRDAPDALLSAYNAGISHKCRQQAPVACASLDRKALLSFAEAQAGDKVEALVCWSCGCSHAYVQEIAAKGNIQWRRPLESPPNAATDKSYFLGRPTNEVEDLFGLEPYLEKYNQLAPGVKLTDHEAFAAWQTRLPPPSNAALLCCPEA